ncbi:MAG: ABC transporter ATP-binding protein [Candidatus Geothermincolia bacterium]
MELSEIGQQLNTDRKAIEIDNVGKCFRIYRDLNQSLKEKMINWRKRGFERFWALDGVSLDIYAGETLSIIGPNGSGKSTLLRLMTGIMTPNVGSIKTNGKVAAMLELGAGFQPDLTGKENIYLNASVLGFSKRDVDAIYDQIVDFAELGPFIDNQVKNYSSGMYVRLGFSVAINVNPDILLVDEVLAVGDEAFQTKCLDKINGFQRAGKTIVLVTHNVDLAAQISDRILWLENGKQLRLGDPKAICGEYHERMRVNPEGMDYGTREIVFSRVEILGDDGMPKDLFTYGDGMVLRLSWEAPEPVELPVFGFGIYDHLGLMVYGTNTRLKGITVPRVEGKGRVEFRIKNLPMSGGRYYLSVASHTEDGLKNYHWQDKMYFFDVESPGADAGYLNMECGITLDGEGDDKA